MIPKEDWVWYGHAAHFICGQWCRFHLATKVGEFLISTVGEYWPDRIPREIHAEFDDPQWLANNRHLKGDNFDFAYMKRFGFQEIGHQRKYETMVFEAGKTCSDPECNCGLPTITGHELAFEPANSAGVAAQNHYDLCEKAARGLIKVEEEVAE
jgi:hypothetical protein